MDWQKVNKEVASVTYDSLGKLFSDDGIIPEKGLRFVIDENKAVAKTNREVSFAEVADFAILREAQNELRIRNP
jgi:hypothetical protein